MADALVSTQPAPDTILAIDILNLAIDPPFAAVISGTTTLAPARTDGRVFYRLRITWASGKIETKEGNVTPADFNTNLSAWCQATPKKKFLQSLVTLGYEPHIIPQ